MMSDNCINKLISNIRKLIPTNEPIAIACSGGADSMSLLWACSKAGYTPRIYHIIHDMRDYSECKKDMECAKAFADKNNLVFRCEKIQAKKFQEDNGGNLENICSDIRYSTMLKWCKEDNIKYLLTAHNADDQLETLIMKICRGSGIDGMQGISEFQTDDGINLVRPMLGVTKQQIYDICKDKKLEWEEDQTNTDTEYSRNFLRKNVLPLLKSIWPCASQNASNLAKIVKDANSIIRDRVNALHGIEISKSRYAELEILSNDPRDNVPYIEEISISRIRLIEENNTVIYNWIKDCVRELDSSVPAINNTLFSSMIPVIRSTTGIKKHSNNFHCVFNLKGVTVHVYSKTVEIVKNN